MFHSAGFFRGVPCPFFEHGLCHRPHCHYRHSKPTATKPPLKPPVLRINHNIQTSRGPASHGVVGCAGSTRQGASGVGGETTQGSSGGVRTDQGSSGPDQDTIGSAKGSLDKAAVGDQKSSSELVEAVPQVVGAIEQISNYFGSSGTTEQASSTTGQASGAPTGSFQSSHPAGGPVESGDHTTMLPPGEQGDSSGSGNTAIGQLSREDIGRLAGAIAEQLTDAPDTPTEEHADMPSYAPEKCIAEQGDGEGSFQALPPTSAGVKSTEVSKLQNILVSEKEIFGGPIPLDEESDSDEGAADGDMRVDGGDAEMADIGDVSNGRGSGGTGVVCDSGIKGFLDDAGEMCDDVGDSGCNDDEPMEELSSSQPLTEAQMIAEFLKVTSTSEDPVKDSGAGRKRSRQVEEKEETNVVVKKKRVAHPQAESVGMRDPVRVEPKPKVVDSNFSAMVKEGDLFMGKKRTANKVTAVNVQRPRIPVDPRAKIASKVRQGYLDGYIDEYIKMHLPPQDAYQKALEEEQELFTSSKGSRSAYLHKSYQALKQLRAKVEDYLTQQREESNKRVQKAKEMSTHELVKTGEKPLGSSSEVASRKSKDRNKSQGVAEGMKGWKSLNAELQATFNHSHKHKINATKKMSKGDTKTAPVKETKTASMKEPKENSSLPATSFDSALSLGTQVSTAKFYSKRKPQVDQYRQPQAKPAEKPKARMVDLWDVPKARNTEQSVHDKHRAQSLGQNKAKMKSVGQGKVKTKDLNQEQSSDQEKTSKAQRRSDHDKAKRSLDHNKANRKLDTKRLDQDTVKRSSDQDKIKRSLDQDKTRKSSSQDMVKKSSDRDQVNRTLDDKVKRSFDYKVSKEGVDQDKTKRISDQDKAKRILDQDKAKRRSDQDKAKMISDQGRRSDQDKAKMGLALDKAKAMGVAKTKTVKVHLEKATIGKATMDQQRDQEKSWKNFSLDERSALKKASSKHRKELGQGFKMEHEEGSKMNEADLRVKHNSDRDRLLEGGGHADQKNDRQEGKKPRLSLSRCKLNSAQSSRILYQSLQKEEHSSHCVDVGDLDPVMVVEPKVSSPSPAEARPGRHHRIRSASGSSTSSSLSTTKQDPVLIDLTSELFGSESSEDSVVLLSESDSVLTTPLPSLPTTPAPSLPITPSDSLPILSLGVEEDMLGKAWMERSPSNSCMVLSEESDGDDDGCRGGSFADALTQGDRRVGKESTLKRARIARTPPQPLLADAQEKRESSRKAKKKRRSDVKGKEAVMKTPPHTLLPGIQDRRESSRKAKQKSQKSKQALRKASEQRRLPNKVQETDSDSFPSLPTSPCDLMSQESVDCSGVDSPLFSQIEDSSLSIFKKVPSLKLFRAKLNRLSASRSSMADSRTGVTPLGPVQVPNLNTSPSPSPSPSPTPLMEDDCFTFTPLEEQGKALAHGDTTAPHTRSGSGVRLSSSSSTSTGTHTSTSSDASSSSSSRQPSSSTVEQASHQSEQAKARTQSSSDRSSGRGRKTSTAGQDSDLPSYKPCGPYINLTRVAQKTADSSISSSQVKRIASSLPKVVKKQRQVSSKLNTKSSFNPATSGAGGSFGKPTPMSGGAKDSSGRPSTSSTKSSKDTSQPNYAILKKKELPPLTSELFYCQMWSYLLTEEQLQDNRYPRPTEEEGVASLNIEGEVVYKVQALGPNAVKHECCRCRKPFTIYNNGQYQTVESCSYHYGRAFKHREYGEGVVSKYSCCGEPSGSPGCQLAKLHVTAGETRSSDSGYVQTSPWPEPGPSYQPHPRGQSVYALDCEMCYTTRGLQLARVSVVDMNLKPVYEKLVKPSHPIVDYNTRFSGLTAEDFVGVESTLSDVQQDLLNMFSDETILVGHSLESDFKALKLLHSRVVDTAIVFPHRLGPPYKKALKTLAKDILRKFIQDTGDEGHDSLEDSRTCMELMLWKVKGDIKAMCRRSGTSK